MEVIDDTQVATQHERNLPVRIGILEVIAASQQLDSFEAKVIDRR